MSRMAGNPAAAFADPHYSLKQLQDELSYSKSKAKL